MKNSFFKKLIIGGAQLGMSYGYTRNKLYKNKSEQRKLLNLAKRFGINKIDTAQRYGCSEKNIGLNKNYLKKIFIISKFDLVNYDKKKNSLYSFIKNSLTKTLKRLNIKKINILMIHRFEDLKIYKNKLITALEKIKKDKLIGEVGISVYSPNELKYSCKFKLIKNIQIPFNILDNRWLRPSLFNYLNKKKVKIHARSIFLRGLLLNSYVPSKFKKISKKIDLMFQKYIIMFNRENKIDLCLAYVKSFRWIDFFVIGFINHKQFEEVLLNFKNPSLKKNEVNLINNEMRKIIKSKKILMPNLWKN